MRHGRENAIEKCCGKGFAAMRTWKVCVAGLNHAADSKLERLVGGALLAGDSCAF